MLLCAPGGVTRLWKKGSRKGYYHVPVKRAIVRRSPEGTGRGQQAKGRPESILPHVGIRCPR